MMPRERTRSTRLFGLMLLPIYTSACLLLFFCYLPLFLLCVAASIASAVPPRVPRQDPPSHSRMAKGLSRICLAHGEGDEGKKLGGVLWRNQNCPLHTSCAYFGVFICRQKIEGAVRYCTAKKLLKKCLYTAGQKYLVLLTDTIEKLDLNHGGVCATCFA